MIHTYVRLVVSNSNRIWSVFSQLANTGNDYTQWIGLIWSCLFLVWRYGKFGFESTKQLIVSNFKMCVR